MERRLAAILAADVVGYSTLMAADETGTLAALKTHRAELFDPLTAKHNGRIVKLMGDGVLVEFSSIVDAVQCALAVQRAIAVADGPIKLRIGINLGDVIIEGDDIYGDGVNVAARLEALAPPGGICISSVVQESLGLKVETKFADVGEHNLKNIAKPIRVYHWPADDDDFKTEQSGDMPLENKPSLGGHKPAIAIKKFENLSKDDELGFFCEGIAGDIETAIGNVDQLVVVTDQAGSSGQQVARYVLEGSVRKGGDRLRISSQLRDTFAGVQCWAERYDRNADDLFEVQDDVTRNIVNALHTELGAGAYTNRWQIGTNNFEAWQLTAKAFNEFQKFSPDSMTRSAAMWERAVAIDPDYHSSRIAAAYCHAHMALSQDDEEKKGSLAKAQAAVDLVIAAAPEDSRPYSALRGIHIAKGEYEDAIVAARRGHELDTSGERRTYAHALMCAGMPDEALIQINKSILEIPNYPGWFAYIKIQAHYMLDQLDEALAEANDVVMRQPDFYMGPALQAALLIEMGRVDEARQVAAKIVKADPAFSTDKFVKSQGIKDAGHRKRLYKALAGAGLPE
jgi:adenylate cyclase